MYFFLWSMEHSTMHCALVCIIYFSLFLARLLLLNLNLGAASKDSSECCRDGQTKVHNNNSKRNVNILSQFISYVTNSLLQGNLLKAVDNKTFRTQVISNFLHMFSSQCHTFHKKTNYIVQNYRLFYNMFSTSEPARYFEFSSFFFKYLLFVSCLIFLRRVLKNLQWCC